ncbi:hypothetical protein HK100_002783 [Physocladia obscura]|uniref:Uncharacterized protein n=1 Tax=Physocladia obscura TaxID=109957 RepID=A0AAD5T835_9FUNG|nr:hypothetical protein HK100_002783 [Physocladia obscura]
MTKEKVLLWVDDKPENNAAIINAAQAKGVKVYTYDTTEAVRDIFECALFLLLNSYCDQTPLKLAQAVQRVLNLDLSLNEIDLRLITDLHRFEKGIEVKDAGIQLIHQLKKENVIAPVLIFSGPDIASNFSTLFPGEDATVTSDRDVVSKFALFG